MTKSVLVVDDNIYLADTTARALCELGFDARSATNARQALRMANEHHFDGAVIDIDLKGRVDGIQLLRAMREINPRVLAILITGHDAGAMEVPAGMDVLRKPFRVGELVSAVFRDPPANP